MGIMRTSLRLLHRPPQRSENYWQGWLWDVGEDQACKKVSLLQWIALGCWEGLFCELDVHGLSPGDRSYAPSRHMYGMGFKLFEQGLLAFSPAHLWCLCCEGGGHYTWARHSQALRSSHIIWEARWLPAGQKFSYRTGFTGSSRYIFPSIFDKCTSWRMGPWRKWWSR